MSNVLVEKGKSGDWYRISYGGQVDYLDHEPSSVECEQFLRSVVSQRQRERALDNMPKLPDGYTPGGVQSV